MSINSSADDKGPAVPRIRVLMVCLGNICRSPTAHGVLEKLIENKSLSRSIEVDSAGTSTYHLGDHPDPRSIAAARRRGYRLEEQLARQVSSNDFYDFDYVLAMDADNLQHLKSIAPKDGTATVQLLLDYSESPTKSVPDPYLDGRPEGFEQVLDIIEAACHRLLEQLEQELARDEAER